jgi:hypothetical protein
MIWCIIWKDNLVVSRARALILTNSDWESRTRNTPQHLGTGEPSQWLKTSQTTDNCVEQPVAGHCGYTLTSSQQSGKQKNVNLMEAIPLCDNKEVYIYVYIYLRLDTTNYTILSNYELISVWRHVSTAHAAIFRPDALLNFWHALRYFIWVSKLRLFDIYIIHATVYCFYT